MKSREGSAISKREKNCKRRPCHTGAAEELQNKGSNTAAAEELQKSDIFFSSLSPIDKDKPFRYNLLPLQRAINSAVECHLHTVEVVGSNPISPTIAITGLSEASEGPFFCVAADRLPVVNIREDLR